MQNKKSIAIIGAMDCEVEMFKNILKDTKEINEKSFKIYTGTIGNNNVYVAKSGVGKVNSASCTQFIADKFKPDYIINTGIAGGVGENLSVGDIVIATSLVQYDFNVSALGYAIGYMCTGIENQKPTVYYSDEKLVSQFENLAKTVMENNSVHRGVIASGDTFVADSNKKLEIKKLFNAKAVEMEGCAIAQVATINEIPFVIVRAISDLADGTASKSLEEFEYKSAQISAKVIKDILENETL